MHYHANARVFNPSEICSGISSKYFICCIHTYTYLNDLPSKSHLRAATLHFSRVRPLILLSIGAIRDRKRAGQFGSVFSSAPNNTGVCVCVRNRCVRSTTVEKDDDVVGRLNRELP